MTSTTIVHIFFHGLIAFVQDRPGGGMISAYALQHDDHATVISFKMTGESKCVDHRFKSTKCYNYCILGAPWCICEIKDPSDVSFRPSSKYNHNIKIPRKPLATRPLHLDSTFDLSWLVKMSNVDGNKGVAKPLAELDDKVRANLSFGWRRAQACHIDQVEDDEECEKGDCSYRIYPHAFVTASSSAASHVQALAEGIMFEVPFDSSTVSLLIEERGGSGRIEVKLGCSAGRCPDLAFNNDIYESMHNESDEGRHFLEYYNIADELPPPQKKRFPRRLREGVGSLPVGLTQLTTCSEDPMWLMHNVLEGAEVRSPSPELTGRDLDRALLLNLFKNLAIRGYQTRVICPMALFENGD